MPTRPRRQSLLDSTIKRRRSSQESRLKLVQAARDEFRQFGFAGATTAAIARNAKTSEAHLFRHFPSKADLFREAVFEALDEHFAAFGAKHDSDIAGPSAIRAQARLYIHELQRFLGEHSDLLLSLVAAQTFSAGALAGDSRIASLETYFKRGAALMRKRVHGKLRVEPDLLVRVSFAAVLGCVIFRNWICPPGTASDRKFSDAVIDFIIEGINVNHDPGLLPA